MLTALQRLGRARIVLLTGIVLVSATGWLVLVHLSAGMAAPEAPGMPGMLMPDLRRAPASGYGMVLAMWVVMMIAMMAPAGSPAASAYLVLTRRRHPKQSAMPSTASFIAGYLAAWLIYAALGAAMQSMLAGTALLFPMNAVTNTHLGSSIVIAVGAYQLTPLKQVCIVRCRSPLPQLMSGWRDGMGGALRLGFSHGRWCVGCCWALMALMFVVGIMNLAWMAILTIFILVEKLVDARWHLDTVSGLLLIAWGAWLLARVVFGNP